MHVGSVGFAAFSKRMHKIFEFVNSTHSFAFFFVHFVFVFGVATIEQRAHRLDLNKCISVVD